VAHWVSSRYRDALQSAGESLTILAEEGADNPYLTTAYIKNQLIAGWSLVFLGQLGAALHETQAAIAAMEKNGNHYRAKTMQLSLALGRLNAFDFPGVLDICESVFPSFAHSARTIERRFCLALAALAETALGFHTRALERLSRARDETDLNAVIFSWWVRMLVEQGFVEALLGKGDLEQAGVHAESFLELTLATNDRMFQALAWEANSRILMAKSEFNRAASCVAKATATIEGLEVPLAAWRVHATAAECSQHAGNEQMAKRRRNLSRATIMALANSLPEEDPLRATFLAAPAIRSVLRR
jgi:hypothetical protein